MRVRVLEAKVEEKEKALNIAQTDNRSKVAMLEKCLMALNGGSLVN